MEEQPPARSAEEAAPPQPLPAEATGDSGSVIGSAAIRPVFLGNLRTNYSAARVQEIFTKPILPPGAAEGMYNPFPIDRVDLKRGYCFVFLKDATSQEEKDKVEQFVGSLNGMEVDNVSVALRAEFARGDGRIKRKEDDRRRNIHPSETLFVVNFHEETTRREDLQMLFEPFGTLVRIDMKRNYAFVQFSSVDEATRAKEVTNGGKLDQSVLTVEYVARQRGDGGSRPRGGRDDRGDRRGPRGGYDRRGGQDRPPRGLPPDRFDRGGGSRHDDRDRGDRGDRYDDFRGGGREDFRGRGRDRSPGGYRGGSPAGGGYRGGSPGGYRARSPGGYGGRRSRSRSRSPRGHRSRSPPRRYDDRDRGRYDDYRDGGRRGLSPEGYRDRGRSPEREVYRGGRDDRGYRP